MAFSVMVGMIETAPLVRKEVEKELLRREEATGLSGEELVEAYRAGEIAQTPETIEWANLIAANRLACRGDYVA